MSKPHFNTTETVVVPRASQEPTLTGWISGNPLKDRPGWYDVRRDGLIRRFRWDGAYFRTRDGVLVSYWPFGHGDTFRGLTAPAKD